MKNPHSAGFKGQWLRQESNLDLELRKLLYYPLYYEANLNPAYYSGLLQSTIHNKSGHKGRFILGTAYGNRTRYSTVKGWRINRFTNAAFPFWEGKYTAIFCSSKKLFSNIILMMPLH